MAAKKKRRVDVAQSKTRRRTPPPRTTRETALHRAAHAVAATLLDLPLDAVTIDPAPDAPSTLVCGCIVDCDQVARDARKSTLDANGVMLIAGPVADVLWSGKTPDTEKSTGWKDDLDGIKTILDQLGNHAGRALTSPQRGTAFEEWWARADELLTARQELVALVANELLERGIVTGEWVKEKTREALEQVSAVE